MIDRITSAQSRAQVSDRNTAALASEALAALSPAVLLQLIGNHLSERTDISGDDMEKLGNRIGMYGHMIGRKS